MRDYWQGNKVKHYHTDNILYEYTSLTHRIYE